MGAKELLHELHAAGIRVVVEGDKLLVRPASRLTDSYRAALRAAKSDVIALLTVCCAGNAEAYEERAAIMEFEGGMTRVEAEAVARELLRTIAARACKE